MSEFRTVKESRVEISELMIPSYANFGGKVHGGYILSLMDKIAYACGTRHARNYCVTASVDTVDFRHPVDVGSLLRMMASVNYVGNTSIEVGIRTESHNVRNGTFTHTNTSYFTMVAIGEDSIKHRVPGLILETREDVRRFLEGRERRRLKREYGKARANLKSGFDIKQALEELKEERCEVAWQFD